MTNLGPFAPFWETIVEIADSKKATIFLLGIVGIAKADQLGFDSVDPKWRLLFATILGCTWLISQAVIDTFGKVAVTKQPLPKQDEQPKIG
jgi:hypothetical protein